MVRGTKRKVPDLAELEEISHQRNTDPNSRRPWLLAKLGGSSVSRRINNGAQTNSYSQRNYPLLVRELERKTCFRNCP